MSKTPPFPQMVRIPSYIFAVAFALSATGAWACPPPPPPPQPPAPIENEAPEAYKLKLAEFERAQEQAQLTKAANWSGYRNGVEDTLWRTANRVFLAEITAKGETEMHDVQGRVYGNSPEVTLTIVAWAKGENEGPAEPFKLSYGGMTSCGPYGPVNIVQASVGSRFLVFADSGLIAADSVFGGYSELETVNTRTQLFFARNPARN